MKTRAGGRAVDRSIERGRYTNIVKESRFCPYCKTIIGNEIHFLLVCPLYKEIRKQEMSLKKTNGIRLKKEENITQG